MADRLYVLFAGVAVVDNGVVEAACSVLLGRALKAKEIRAELRKLGIEIDKSELNSLLYTALRRRPGLAVTSDGVWTFSTERQPRATNVALSARSGSAAAHGATGTPSGPTPPGSLDFVPDESQRAVIESGPEARLYVEAGPGTGKTAVACLRIARLIREHHLDPANILVVTFTRTAAAEIRARVGHYVSADAASQLRISTIDSSAWHFDLVAMAATTSTTYDDKIESVVQNLRARDPSLGDLVGSFEQVVVDEAQDVTGLRCELIVELVRACSKTCGVTIFADPLQAIYGFTNGEKIAMESPTEALLRGLPQLERTELRKTHRFSEKLEPELQLARDITRSTTLNGVEKQEKLAEGVQRYAAPFAREYKALIEEVGAKPHALLLCRSRREVVQASSFFLTEGVRHRLRIPNLPDAIQPWIARVFSNHTSSTIDETEFAKRFERCLPMLPNESAVGAAWAQLRRAAPGKRGVVDVKELRRRLSAMRPPVQLCLVDASMSGPTIGTIHASKGREADDVYVFVPDLRENGDPNEEARLLYVAFTRARARLHAVSATKAYGNRLSSGRPFKYERKFGRLKLEVGRAGDLDEAATVSKSSHPTEEVAATVQEHLWRGRDEVESVAAQCGEGFRVELSYGDGRRLGSLSPRFLAEARQAAAATEARLTYGSVRHVFVVGSRTHVVGAGDRSLEEMHEPFATTGFFLVPIVRGYCALDVRGVKAS